MVKFSLKKKIAKALVFAMVMGTVGVHGLNLKDPVAVMATNYEVGKLYLELAEGSTATPAPGKSVMFTVLEGETGEDGTTQGVAPGETVTLTVTKIVEDGDNVAATNEEVSVEGKTITIDAGVENDTKFMVVASIEKEKEDGTKETVESNPITLTVTNASLEYELSYGKYAITVTKGTGDTNIFLEVLKKKGESYTLSATYPYAVESGKDAVTVDLSFLKASAAQYIRVYGNKSGEAYNGTQTQSIIPVNAQASKLSIKYKYNASATDKDDFKSHLTVKEGKNSVENIYDGEKYSFRSLYGTTWQKLNDANFNYKAARVAGTTIVVRKDAVEGEDGAPASPEVKVKIAALPKAPKVSVDYANGIIGLSAKMEYALAAGDVTDTGFVKAAGKTDLSKIIEELNKKNESVQISEKDGFVLVVRTAATTSKSASVATYITIKGVDTLKAYDKEGTTAAAETGVVEGVVKIEKPDGDTNTNDPMLTYGYTFNEKNSVVTDSGITITAKNAAFEYKVTGSSWKTLAAGKSIYLKSVTQLDVRLSGVKENLKSSPQVPGAFPSKEITIKVIAPNPATDSNS